MDYSLIRNCIRPEMVKIFRGIQPMIEPYHFRLVSLFGDKCRVYIERMGENCQYLLEYCYKEQTYQFYRCSKYRNEHTVLLSGEANPLDTVSILDKVFTTDYLAEKLRQHKN